jgi:hypothetical protein
MKSKEEIKDVEDVLRRLEEINRGYTKSFQDALARLERLFDLQQRLTTDIVKTLLPSQLTGSPHSTTKGGE